VIDEITKLDPADETGVGGAMTFKSDLAAMNTKLQEGEPPNGAAARKGRERIHRGASKDHSTAKTGNVARLAELLPPAE
jgi:hypothetical protein